MRLGVALLLSLLALPLAGEEAAPLPARIGFGSCSDQNKPQPVLLRAVERKLDLFVYLGDNIYGDTTDMTVLQGKYDTLAARPEFQALRKDTQLLAVWDDHDYGANDAGKEYPQREASKQIFLDFWQVPADRPNRKRPGIYDAYRYETQGKVLQIILLDTRTFRDRLLRNRPKAAPFKNDYRPDASPDKTLLGEAQWAWLKTQFEQTADLRVIASSLQFGHEYNGWESWTNLPAEQQKMIDLIRSTRANGVLFVSGDVHWAEVSKREIDGGYPLYDITSSGINKTWPSIEDNRFRVGPPCRDTNVGLLEIDWDSADPVVTVQVMDETGSNRITLALPLSELRFPEAP